MTKFDRSLFEGKTIKAVAFHCDGNSDDELKIEFTDGTTLVLEARWCNNSTAALEFFRSRDCPHHQARDRPGHREFRSAVRGRSPQQILLLGRYPLPSPTPRASRSGDRQEAGAGVREDCFVSMSQPVARCIFL
jgi:hypothetical protein